MNAAAPPEDPRTPGEKEDEAGAFGEMLDSLMIDLLGFVRFCATEMREFNPKEFPWEPNRLSGFFRRMDGIARIVDEFNEVSQTIQDKNK